MKQLTNKQSGHRNTNAAGALAELVTSRQERLADLCAPTTHAASIQAAEGT